MSSRHRTARPPALRKILFLSLALLIALLAVPVRAGGPLYVAGVTFFNPGLAGSPLTWAGGTITYYTDLGDLSPLYGHDAANTLVLEAASRWNSVSTAGVNIIRGGDLAENVSGANVSNNGGVITLPADIRPDSSLPVTIVYDSDGKVTDALLGSGASVHDLCDTNSVTGGPDRFTSDGHIAHALIVINGLCAVGGYDSVVLPYQLARMLGRVVGLDWSQLNENVLTGSPAPTSDDLAGFPLMEASRLCLFNSGCPYGANADQLRMDDRAAISRLYPVTSDNIGAFPGKQIFSASTARIHGTVRFPAWHNLPGQGMQGVNVVARWIDPSNSAASRRWAAASVSGFRFRGNAGNPVTGWLAATGERFDRFGSNDPALEGSFDLAGLEFPAGGASAQYELRLEAIHSSYTGNSSVGPYKDAQVTPSGTFAAAIVTVTRGGDVARDFAASGGPSEPLDEFEPGSFSQPAPLPGAGNWLASLGGYGDVDYHQISAHAGRSFSLEVTAVDSSVVATTHKALPVLGLWAPGAAEGSAPAVSQTYFNDLGHAGLTRLQATLAADGVYKLGIADYRGDGRPDFLYRARLLYADTLTPARASIAGGTPLTITGYGFVPGLRVRVAGTLATLVSVTSEEISALAPPLSDGVKDVSVEDPATGGMTTLTGALTYGAASTDKIVLLLGSNPQVPVGAQAPNPMRVRVVMADGVTPVGGASVTFSAPADTVALGPCGARTCTLASNDAGEASVTITVKAAGTTTITATLNNAQWVAGSVNGVASTQALKAVPPTLYRARDTAAWISLVAQLVNSGSPVSGSTINYQVMLGRGTLVPASAVTNSGGFASSVLYVSNQDQEIRVSACLVPGNNPCDIFYVYLAPASGLQMQKLSGDAQLAPAGGAFAPLTVRTLDLNTVPQAVAGVPVTFRVTVFRPVDSVPPETQGEVTTGGFPQPPAIFSSATTVYSDASGLAAFVPTDLAAWGPARFDVQVTAGANSARFALQSY